MPPLYCRNEYDNVLRCPQQFVTQQNYNADLSDDIKSESIWVKNIHCEAGLFPRVEWADYFPSLGGNVEFRNGLFLSQ